MQPSHFFLFQSSLFSPEPGEDDETNLGIYGKQLARWLASKLGGVGYTIAAQVAEDFGRLVELRHPKLKLYAACSNAGDSKTEWRVFPIAEARGLSGLFGSSAKGEALKKLTSDIEAILCLEPEISGLKVEATEA